MEVVVKNKWYEVGLAEPPVGEYVVVAIRLARYRTFIKALYIGAMHYMTEDLQPINPTHFMLLSDPTEG